MANMHLAPSAASPADLAFQRAAEAEYALAEAARTIRLLQTQLRQAQELVSDLRGQLNRASRRD